MFSISVLAENSADSTNEDVPAVSEGMPAQERGSRQGGGGRGGMQAPPQGENPPSGEMPAMQGGEVPQPQDNGNAGTESGHPSQPAKDETATDGDGTANEDSNRIQKDGMGGDMNAEMPTNTANAEADATQSSTGILSFVKTYSTPITAVILLIFAFIFVKLYRRRSY